MKVLVVLSALLAYSSSSPLGHAYTAYAPYAYRSYAPPSYIYNVRPISSFSYSISEPAVIPYAAPAHPLSYSHSVVSYNSVPAPVVKYVAPGPVVAASAPVPLVAAAPAPVPVVAAPAPIVPVAPIVGGKSQYHAQDEIGNAQYGHDEPGQSHHAIQDAAGNKYGSFSYIKPDGSVSITQYSADSEGYRVASNDLPVGPAPVPVAPVVPVLASPVPVASAPVPVVPQTVVSADPSDDGEDTVEVANVLAKRSVENSEKKTRSRRSVVLPNGYLADTPEVAAAKSAHFAEHAKRSAPFYYNAPIAYSAYPFAYSGYPYSVLPYSAYSSYPYAYSAYPYNSYPVAAPVVTPDGYLADTPEVASAKAAHFAEVAIATSRVQRDASLPAEKPADGYAPTYNAESYSRPVDPSAAIAPLDPSSSSGTHVVNNPNHGYNYKQ